MELKQLKIFQVAARELNFTRTAEILHYAQSSVTAQIKSLEEELAVQLFDRLGKRVILTDAGKRFKLYTDKVLDLTEEAKETVGGSEEPSRTLTICASETQCTYRLPGDYRNIFEASLVDAAVQPLCDLELGDIEANKKCVIAGIGIAALPKLAVEKEIEEGSMSVLRWKGPEFPIVTQLVWHKDKWVSPALSAFLDVAREVILDR
ncbi:LysR family transcriptional regulator [Priestia megaterium]|uniref:LysR family transcriptional regulator n=1 Tax=Priestia megaterium TaxID=1404 RepID=UPI00244D2F28|nr:LysR family transcriptional regulator [Priestia megaterium]MDH2359870.1 LysR family transcriptional regulator [Priestia megaterium]